MVASGRIFEACIFEVKVNDFGPEREKELLLSKIFWPTYLKKQKSLAEAPHMRFAHYTSADVAISIIKNRCIWLRNASLMNDSSEITYGRMTLEAACRDQRLSGALDKVGSGIYADAWINLALTEEDAKFGTFMTSLSEHGNRDGEDNLEERYGRLSMWRAYGGPTNVAFIFEVSPFLEHAAGLPVVASPVLYADAALVTQKVHEIADNIEENLSFLRSLAPDQVTTCLSWAMHYAINSTKHPGFAEEREWRLLHNPSLNGSEGLTKQLRCIGGVPQTVYDLPIRNQPELGVLSASLNEILKEIIIGPTSHPIVIFSALIDAMADAGVAEPEKRVRISNIPLRR